MDNFLIFSFKHTFALEDAPLHGMSMAFKKASISQKSHQKSSKDVLEFMRENRNKLVNYFSLCFSFTNKSYIEFTDYGVRDCCRKQQTT